MKNKQSCLIRPASLTDRPDSTFAETQSACGLTQTHSLAKLHQPNCQSAFPSPFSEREVFCCSEDQCFPLRVGGFGILSASRFPSTDSDKNFFTAHPNHSYPELLQ